MCLGTTVVVNTRRVLDLNLRFSDSNDSNDPSSSEGAFNDSNYDAAAAHGSSPVFHVDACGGLGECDPTQLSFNIRYQCTPAVKYICSLLYISTYELSLILKAPLGRTPPVPVNNLYLLPAASFQAAHMGG